MTTITSIGGQVLIDSANGKRTYNKSDVTFTEVDATHIHLHVKGGTQDLNFIALSDLDIDGTPADMAALKTAWATVFPNAGGAASTTYLVYTAVITQEDLSDPVVSVFQNTIGDIVWTRNGVGTYYATLNGAFPADKTWFSNGGAISPVNHIVFDYEDENLAIIETRLFSGGNWALADWILSVTPIEIRVYP